MKKSIKKIYIIAGALATLILVFVFLLSFLNSQMQNEYLANQSFLVKDRNNKTILAQKNNKDYYAEYLDKVPENFKNLLLKKEDKYFYWNFGFNPKGILEVALNEIGISNRQGSSTIPQQLAKILLKKENQRNVSNKFQESFYTLALEIFSSKENILKMYINSVYFGRQMQGLKNASYGYFNIDPENLTEEQITQLLATINSPTNFNPANEVNIEKSKQLAKILGTKSVNFMSANECQKNIYNFSQNNAPILELSEYLNNSIKNNVKLLIDSDLSKKIREIVLQNVEILKTKKAKNAAVVVLSLQDNQIISIIGSPDPSLSADGYQINMSKKPRQIGSTIKPFIYLLGFEKGMRPYTLIDDREYKYQTSDGYYIYPKNFDYKYRGLITAHYALSNSINTAAVKTLDFVGVDDFSDFLAKRLEYTPPQPIGDYQIGIALGAMEMNLLNLAHYFSIFPNQGNLKSLKLFDNEKLNENYFPYQNKKISQEAYIQLINKILSDRKTGIDQFGAKSDLNLQSLNYALKTGTSQDFKDSFVIGYTPDFLVAVWVGNADNSATDGVSGQIGAGKIWNQVMQLILNSDYSHNSTFNFKDVVEYLPPQTSKNLQNGIEFGLKDDNFSLAQNIIENQDKDFILNPHDGDIFAFDKNSKLLFKAKEIAAWKIKNPGDANWQTLASGQSVEFSPKKEGRYQITASSKTQSQTISIYFTLQP